MEKANGGKYYEKLIANNDSVFKIMSKKLSDKNSDIDVEDVYFACDNFFGTNYFSKFYSKNESKILDILTKTDLCLKLPFNLFSINETFELFFDGKLVSTNAPVNQNGTLIWKVNAMRFSSENYELVAEYRTANIWAFVVTFLLAISAIVLFIKAQV